VLQSQVVVVVGSPLVVVVGSPVVVVVVVGQFIGSVFSVVQNVKVQSPATASQNVGSEQTHGAVVVVLVVSTAQGPKLNPVVVVVGSPLVVDVGSPVVVVVVLVAEQLSVSSTQRSPSSSETNINLQFPAHCCKVVVVVTSSELTAAGGAMRPLITFFLFLSAPKPMNGPVPCLIYHSPTTATN
jgi:hypothetical protein